MEISRTAALRSGIPEIAECAQVIKITAIIIPETASAGRKSSAVGGPGVCIPIHSTRFLQGRTCDTCPPAVVIRVCHSLYVGT